MQRFLISKIWKKIGSRNPQTSLKVVFSNGEVYKNNLKKPPEIIISYKNRKSEWTFLFFTDVGFASAYANGDIDIQGDISKLVLMGDRVKRSAVLLRNPLNTIGNHLHEFLYGNRSIKQAKKNALYHYNRGTEMFRQYLDPTMTYTCAYWKDNTKTLVEAQKNKIDHVLKKLRLKEGETLVDIGGGWGSVLFRAYEKYGVLGTNISPTPDQNKAMRKEINRKGLKEKIAIKEIDFREDTGVYDKYVSLGVYEHAGKGQLEDWIKVMANSIKPGGIGLLHFIGHTESGIASTGWYIRKFIFPGGYLPGLAETIELMGEYNLEILDIENLRRHYAKTLKCWGNNFDTNWEKIHKLNPKTYNEHFRRMWRFYLHGCSGAFLKENGTLGLFQITFSKGRKHNYPMTRDFLYK